MPVIEWRPLTSSSVSEQEAYLFKFAPSSKGYVFSATDLSSIWTERCSKSDIVQKAIAIGCPIDPSHDSDQFNILLHHLERALVATHDTQTQCSVAIASSSLEASTAINLPGGLGELRWEFAAQPQNKQSFRDEILLPLLNRVNAQGDAIGDLVHRLQEKDSAVASLLEKVDASGVDFSTIFPTAFAKRSNRKMDTKEQIKRAVKGLDIFDSEDYFTKLKSRETQATPWRDALKQAFETIDLSEAAKVLELNSSHSDPTPARQSEKDIEATKRQPKPNFPATPHSAIDTDDSTTEDDLHTEQDIHVLSSKAKTYTGPQADVSDRNHDSERIRPTQSPPSEVKPASKRPAKKIGAIGGAKAQKKSNGDTADLGTESVDETVESPTTKQRIGIIGGRKPGQGPTKDIANTNRAFKSGLERESGPLISHGSGDAPTSQVATSANVGAATMDMNSAVSYDPKKGADAKRDALKRELEAREKPPSKKKRKF